MDFAKHTSDAKVAALAAAGVVAAALVTPVPTLPRMTAVERELLLVSGADSLLNVPFNLFQDFVNIPNTEVGALQQLGDSLIFSGPWWTASATNIWGEDPGDPGHFMSVVDMALPFKELSGQGLGELQGFDSTGGPQDIDVADVASGNLGLSQQAALLADAEIPVSASSDADWSAPLFPVSPITGDTSIDRDIWFFASLLGIQKYPLFENWFKVPISDLTGGSFQFGNAVEPSMGVGTNGAVAGDGNFLGTHPLMGDHGYGVNDVGQALNANGNPINLMPWSNLNFTLNLAAPFQHFFQSLQATPDYSVGAGGFQFPSLEEFGRALQTAMAGSIIAFWPNVPGSFACAPACGVPAANLTALVQDIDKMWPGNTSVEHWLALTNTPAGVDPTSDSPYGGPGGGAPFGMANGPTDHQVDTSNAYSTPIQQTFDVGNPQPDVAPTGVDTPISFPVSPEIVSLQNFMKEIGVLNFFTAWAAGSGYVPVDPNDISGAADSTSAAAATTPDYFTDLLHDAGLGSLIGLL